MAATRMTMKEPSPHPRYNGGGSSSCGQLSVSCFQGRPTLGDSMGWVPSLGVYRWGCSSTSSLSDSGLVHRNVLFL